ncbi:hypothetical protein SAMN05444266_101625 [Chitinophaga jiangningensis]|uniref:Uncharacterized protein n=1 Tax=Chitinophaga jiangningensis TaxID=1419482 RepID=A0A1M6WHC1_9BACT|nr:hypothetical protein [Chitinophaga jiangningensis]SHK93088.1 hypothetical protein SAMN05444266_101625 [Chitinophaga jiangningensis]
MRILINDMEVVIPSSLSEITLGQRIDFHNQFGKAFDAHLDSIMAMEDGVPRDIEIMDLNLQKAYAAFSFFSEIDIDVLRQSAFTDEILQIYHSSLAQLFQHEQEIVLQDTYYFNGEKWQLSTPELHPGHRMRFGEFIDAKQIALDLYDFGQGKWDVMLRLCAIYLRREGEEYAAEFTRENSQRLQLMRSLPLEIALSVAFFLSASMSIYYNTSRFSHEVGLKHMSPTQLSTSSAGAG